MLFQLTPIKKSAGSVIIRFIRVTLIKRKQRQAIRVISTFMKEQQQHSQLWNAIRKFRSTVSLIQRNTRCLIAWRAARTSLLLRQWNFTAARMHKAVLLLRKDAEQHDEQRLRKLEDAARKTKNAVALEKISAETARIVEGQQVF